MNTKYGYIIEDLRKNVFEQVVNELFKTAKVSIPQIDEEIDSRDECAKAFLIWLAISRFGISIESDIVLCHMGLLKGYSTITGLQDRRKKLFIESNYLFSGRNGTFESKDMTENELNYQARQFNKVDKPLLESMIMYFDSLSDKAKRYTEASDIYLGFIRNSSTVRRARLPLPSFAVKFNMPIRYIKRMENPAFCGREEILAEMEDYFSSKQIRRIILLNGMGGVGKTQIALKYTYLHQQEYSTIVWLNVKDYNALIDQCRSFLLEYTKLSGTVDLVDPESVRIQFRRFINTRPNSLLILDNVEYIGCNDEEFQNMQEELASIIPASNIHVIVTTRSKRVFYHQKRILIDVFNPTVSAMFLEAKTVLPRDDYSELLAERLGHLPLALEYAGAYIATQRITYKDYLALWDKYGAELFDKKGYSEKTIRQAFHITLDKILDNTDESAAALDLLIICAQHKLDYLPIKSYLELVEEDHCNRVNCFREWLKTGQYLDSFYFPAPNSKDGKFYHYRLVEIIDDDTIKYECLSEPFKGQTIIQRTNKTIKLLSDELTRGEIIRRLSEYSLISWNGDVIIVHPMLREIILDEFVDKDRLFNDDYSFFSYNATLYHRFGDANLALKYEHEALRQALDSFERNSKITESIIEKQGSFFNAAESIVWLTDVSQRILKYGDDTLIKRAIECLFSFTKLLYDTDDITHCKETVLRYEKDFFNQLSWQIGYPIIWKRCPTPSECKQLQVNSIYEATEIEDYNNAPHLESAKAAIDIWCDDKTDIVKIKDNSNWRIAAIRA